MARPTNREKYSVQAQKDKLRVICGEALAQLQRQIKKADVNTLANFIVKMIPIVLDDNTQTESDVTMDLLIKKAIKVNLRIKEANEEGIREEEPDEEESAKIG